MGPMPASMVCRTILLSAPLLIGGMSACAPELPPQVVSIGNLPRNGNMDFILVGQGEAASDPGVEVLRGCLVSAGMTAGSPPRYAVQLSRTIRERGTRVVLPDDQSQPPRRHLRHLMQANSVTVSDLAGGSEVYRLTVSGRTRPGAGQGPARTANAIDDLFCQALRTDKGN